MNELTINNRERITPERILKEESCFNCGKTIEIKFVNRSRNFGQKNNWNYWTEQTNVPEKYICSPCLRNMYYRDFPNLCKQVGQRKRQMMKTYFSLKVL